MSSNDENRFRKGIVNSAKALEMHCIDIADEAKRLIAFYPELATVITRKPYDLQISWQGQTIAMELKLFKKEFSFVPRACLRHETEEGIPHQYQSLREAVEKGGIRAGMLVQFRRALTDAQRKKLDIKHGYLLDLTFWLEYDRIELDRSYSIQDLRREAVLIENTKELYGIDCLWKNKKDL